LSTDFNTRFVPQTESYAEQAFWSQYSIQTNEPTHSGTTIVEVPKELPKVSMCKLLAVGSPFFWQWEHPPLAVGTYIASGNSLLAVGMPCAFYSQHLNDATPRVDVAKKVVSPSLAISSDGDASGKSSCADVTGKPSGKKLIIVLCLHRGKGGRSSYARAMIELRADVELKDNIVMALPKIKGGQAILVDEAGNPLKKVEYMGDYDSEDKVASVNNDRARSMASKR
nr:hypothetical protein [Tanacetum cinerariifolium]